MHIVGSKFFLIGKAIEVKRDIIDRMGIYSPTLDCDTQYVIYSDPLNQDQKSLLNRAKKNNIHCLELEEYLNLAD